MNTTKRICSLDYLKAIGIILMLLGHTSFPLTFYIYTFHMGLFFFISGFLCYNKLDVPFTTYLKKRAKSCLIPYVAFWAIGLVISEIVSLNMNGTNITFDFNTIKALLLGGHYLSDYTDNFAIWYLQTNFIVAIVFYLIIKLCKGRIAKIIAFAVILIGTIPFQNLFEDRPIFHINVLPSAITFMFLGYFIAYIKDYVDKIPFFVGFLFIIPGMITWPDHVANIATIGSYWYYLFAFLTIVGLYIIFKNTPGNRFITFMSTSTLYILGLHFPLLPVSNAIADYISELTGITDNYILSPIQTIFLATVCCLMGLIYTTIKKAIKASVLTH